MENSASNIVLNKAEHMTIKEMDDMGVDALLCSAEWQQEWH